MLTLALAACSFSLAPTVVQRSPAVQQRSPVDVRMWMSPEVYRAPNGEFVWEEAAAIEEGIDPRYLVQLEEYVEDMCLRIDYPMPDETVPDEGMLIHDYMDMLQTTANRIENMW